MGISLGLVGLGSFGTSFAKLFKSHPLVDRVGFCDMEPSRVKKFAEDPFFADKFNGSDCYGSLDEILKADFDAIVIITQPWLHAPQCIAAMEAGKHVYSAVPVISLPDFDEMLDWSHKVIRCCEKTGMHYMLGETTIYRAKTMFCHRMATEGKFGNFVYAEGEYIHDVDSNCNLRKVVADRTASTAGAPWIQKVKDYAARGIKSGPMSYPTHSVSGPVRVMGAHAVKACGIGYRNQTGDTYFENDEFSNTVGLFKMSNGASCRILEFREAPGHFGDSTETFRIAGTAGTFSNGTWYYNGRTSEKDVPKTTVTDMDEKDMRDPLPKEVSAAFQTTMTEHQAKDPQRDHDADFVPSGHGGSHPYLVHEFVSAVAENRVPVINAWEAGAYMAMGVAAHQSALKDGEWLDVVDFGQAPQ